MNIKESVRDWSRSNSSGMPNMQDNALISRNSTRNRRQDKGKRHIRNTTTNNKIKYSEDDSK